MGRGGWYRGVAHGRYRERVRSAPGYGGGDEPQERTAPRQDGKDHDAGGAANRHDDGGKGQTGREGGTLRCPVPSPEDDRPWQVRTRPVSPRRSREEGDGPVLRPLRGWELLRNHVQHRRDAPGLVFKS